MDKIIQLYTKYKQIIAYLVFGVFTVVVNFAFYLFFAKILTVDYIISNGIAWIAAVMFAFVTNKLFVFKSEAKDIKSICMEFTVFVGCRIVSGIMDMLIMYVFIDALKYNDVIIKVLSCVLVIIANYILSKVVVFRKKSMEQNFSD
ncbi:MULTISPECIES: GtrA family protein [unclassified Paenibacillus]|uniref:GtrA family protein n=1 Tax=unclassified Paenibacillus TaxID=185978 RepID=UPI0036296D64